MDAYWLLRGDVGATTRSRSRRFGFRGQAQLFTTPGRGYTEKSLRHMIRFAEAFPDEEIVSALRRELSWTHFKEIIYLDLLFYHRRLCRLVAID